MSPDMGCLRGRWRGFSIGCPNLRLWLSYSVRNVTASNPAPSNAAQINVAKKNGVADTSLSAAFAKGQPVATMTIALPSAVDLSGNLSDWDIPTRAQANRPTCSVFAVVGALEYAIASREKRGANLSVDFLNWASKDATGRKEDGGFFWQLWNGYAAHGICEETLMPYELPYDPQRAPSDAAKANAALHKGLAAGVVWVKEWDPNTGLSDEQHAEIKRTIAEGLPVCGGFRWPKNAEWTNGVLDMRAPEDVFDGHSVLLTGYRNDETQDGGGVFLIRNSGGPSRDGALSYEYVRAYMNDALVIMPA